MAADKEIMKQIETLRLDRPGRTYQANGFEGGLTAALHELAATYREEAGLWAKSGARGWKSSETEAYLVAQAIDTVAAQLDNAGGGAALSVSDPALEAEINDIERQLDKSAERVAAVRDLSGLDKLIADSVAERRGFVREPLPQPTDPIGAATFPGQASADEVTAYLRGDADDIPGSAPLTPGSVTSAPEADDPFALTSTRIASLVGQLDETLQPAPPYCRDCDLDMHRCYGCGEPVEHGKHACAQCELINAVPDVSIPRQTDAMPKTWESETMTADGHRPPGLAPLLGQPGDASAGYSHTYVPPGGRVLTFDELLTVVPADRLPIHMSHSQGNTIGDCATQYRLQRVEQMPQVPQWANIGGSAFHAAVEAIERTLINAAAAGRPLSLDGYDVDLGWKEHFEERIRIASASSSVPISMWRGARKGAEGRQWWEVNGPLMLRRYLDARPDEPSITIDSGGAPAIEWGIVVDVPTPYGPLPFKAVLDRVTHDPALDAVIIRDYKTSYERPTDTTQLGDYAHTLLLSGANLHGAKRILGQYFDARRGEWTEPVDLLATHPFEAFRYRVTAAHAQKRALTTGPTPARPSNYCGGCSVRYACPIMNQLKAVAPPAPVLAGAVSGG